jgi:cell division protein FtsL
MFKWIVGLSALLIAGTAAYFSVTGIALLFSGATLGVAIMAGSLELGKLVAASYLHRYWNKINFLFKFYFTTAVLALIFITSMGIFGFLSNAYQKTSLQVQQIESQVEILLTQRSGLTDDISRSERRIQILTDQRSSQETRYDSLVANENWVNARRTFELIEGADTEIRGLTSQINEIRQKISDIDTQVLAIRSENMDVAREIGGFRFIADAFNVPIDTAVKWFIIMLIFVFDPLAVSLVIAYNKLTEVHDDTSSHKTYKIYGEEKWKEKLKNTVLSFDYDSDDDKSDEELWENTLEDGLDDIPYEESQDKPDKTDTEKDLGRVSDTPQIKPNSKKVIEN